MIDGLKRKQASWVIVFMYIFACVVCDFCPWHGGPDFRYTGADPAVAVWNFGWPASSFIYDARDGLHFDVLVIPVVAIQVFILLMAAVVVGIVQWYGQRGKRGFSVVK